MRMLNFLSLALIVGINATPVDEFQTADQIVTALLDTSRAYTASGVEDDLERRALLQKLREQKLDKLKDPRVIETTIGLLKNIQTPWVTRLDLLYTIAAVGPNEVSKSLRKLKTNPNFLNYSYPGQEKKVRTYVKDEADQLKDLLTFAIFKTDKNISAMEIVDYLAMNLPRFKEYRRSSHIRDFIFCLEPFLKDPAAIQFVSAQVSALANTAKKNSNSIEGLEVWGDLLEKMSDPLMSWAILSYVHERHPGLLPSTTQRIGEKLFHCLKTVQRL